MSFNTRYYVLVSIYWLLRLYGLFSFSMYYALVMVEIVIVNVDILLQFFGSLAQYHLNNSKNKKENHN